jgi:hypothetical protein
MTIRAFLVWLVVAAVSAVAALAAVVGQPTSSVDPLSREPVFKQLRAAPDEVARVTVSSRFDTFTFIRENGRWRAPDKFDYPVDSTDVRELVVKLSDMRYIERKTSKAERFERLEVNDIKEETSEAVLVRMATADDKPLAEVIVGRPSARFIDGSVSGTYIRFPDSDDVWLASGAVNVQTRLVPWLDRTIVSIPADTVTHVVIGAGEGSYEVVREGVGDSAAYAIPQVPEGREVDARAAQSLTRTLASVSLEDVKPAADLTLPADAKQARFETQDGIAVDLRLAEIDRKPWMTVNAAYTGDAGDEGEAAKAARQRVADINARVNGWVYWVPSDIFERLTAPLDKQLIEEKKEGQS